MLLSFMPSEITFFGSPTRFFKGQGNSLTPSIDFHHSTLMISFFAALFGFPLFCIPGVFSSPAKETSFTGGAFCFSVFEPGLFFESICPPTSFKHFLPVDGRLPLHVGLFSSTAVTEQAVPLSPSGFAVSVERVVYETVSSMLCLSARSFG